ncbi:CoA binding domain-containing protein [Sporobacter termitidis DSM 10068]|uniref:CoA binding domain-containing protein n=1 Tax=Sporobacter termitidis DSM 10068 TaxID=1123282 RepID=A0A1M5XSC5_9FIRM|nr:CoA-binding protein [Sporobacter termitidis]SHI02434.1 CoA binding domain-containing protein [Sporobacter termitidis DSM 10068]
MAKLTKDFFTDGEVLILGYPLKDDPSMKMILQAFQRGSIAVYAMNPNAEGDREVKIYKSFAELPKVPRCAYIYLEKEEITPWISQMKENGVQRVLFHSKKDVEPSDVDACRKTGLETAIACPLMLLGGGIHKFHKLLAGV